MPRSDPQYALYEVLSASVPNQHGALSTALVAASLPLPHWLSGNIVLSGKGIFVVYYSVFFSDKHTSSALFQNEFEIPATRIQGAENHGYIILSTSGNLKTRIGLHATTSTVCRGKILIAELSFHDEQSMVE